jgi:outer membrane protein OmpA-like peptidoglycan-associated protein
MSATVRLLRFAIVLGCLATAAGGCQLTGLTVAPRDRPVAHSITVRDRVNPWSLTVVAGGEDAPEVSAMVRDTAQPSEYLDIIAGGRQARVVIASVSPAAPSVVTDDKPGRPPAGSSSYQWSKYREAVNAWAARLAAARRKAASLAEARVTRWFHSLRIPGQLAALPSADKHAGSLVSACSAGASVITVNRAQPMDDKQRVLLLFVSNLAGTIPMGELNGDALIVVTGYLPTTAAASAAQIKLIRAGALRATIVGPQESEAQLAMLINADQNLTGRTVVFPDSALFATGSATLRAAARRALRALLPQLRKPGATAVINGYASTSGTRRENYLLSYARAAAVATFVEARGVAASAISVVGHGAAGPSRRDQRVAVLIEQS